MLTHWSRDKMAAIFQTTFSNAFFSANVWISIKISLKSVHKGAISNIPALVQIMAWRRPGDKPLSEPMMVRLPTHICVIPPQWVNRCCLFDYMRKLMEIYVSFSGWLFDYTQSYQVPFLCAGAAFVMSSLTCIPMKRISTWQKRHGSVPEISNITI